ncbi:hypothetical protein B0T25DRAFT_126857 [Lasiosphaeria hispida]|uniref:Uncharacterized protein n=1 Tax=Lasiosphaeria hispida TaxID=260671 RepID=A0AAJ0HS32_9PEZI|nr:hypothetical protein B0T25DRAFT_126857 [Lasiosphaeria hispida]
MRHIGASRHGRNANVNGGFKLQRKRKTQNVKGPRKHHPTMAVIEDGHLAVMKPEKEIMMHGASRPFSPRPGRQARVGKAANRKANLEPGGAGLQARIWRSSWRAVAMHSSPIKRVRERPGPLPCLPAVRVAGDCHPERLLTRPPVGPFHSTPNSPLPLANGEPFLLRAGGGPACLASLRKPPAPQTLLSSLPSQLTLLALFVNRRGRGDRF